MKKRIIAAFIMALGMMMCACGRTADTQKETYISGFGSIALMSGITVVGDYEQISDTVLKVQVYEYDQIDYVTQIPMSNIKSIVDGDKTTYLTSAAACKEDKAADLENTLAGAMGIWDYDGKIVSGEDLLSLITSKGNGTNFACYILTGGIYVKATDNEDDMGYVSTSMSVTYKCTVYDSKADVPDRCLTCKEPEQTLNSDGTVLASKPILIIERQ